MLNEIFHQLLYRYLTRRTLLSISYNDTFIDCCEVTQLNSHCWHVGVEKEWPASWFLLVFHDFVCIMMVLFHSHWRSENFNFSKMYECWRNSAKYISYISHLYHSFRKNILNVKWRHKFLNAINNKPHWYIQEPNRAVAFNVYLVIVTEFCLTHLGILRNYVLLTNLCFLLLSLIKKQRRNIFIFLSNV